MLIAAYIPQYQTQLETIVTSKTIIVKLKTGSYSFLIFRDWIRICNPNMARINTPEEVAGLR